MGVGQGTGDDKKRWFSKTGRGVGFAVVAAGLAVVLAACSSSPTVSGNVPLSKALADYFAGNVSLAKSEFQAIVKTDPSNVYAWYDLGVIAQAANDSSATTDYLKAIALDPTFESPDYNLGVLYFQADKIDNAITYLKRAVALNAQDANAHWNYGLALARKDIKTDNKLATEQLNAALKLDPALIKTLGVPSKLSRPAPTHGGTGPKGSGGSGPATKTTVAPKTTTSAKTTTS
jgi:tetratricopeptide (TPR) repeat protein